MYPTARTAGSIELVYRYTIVGSDKASIDTGSDAAQGGSNDWTNCDLLELFIYARTDEAAAGSNVSLTFNNDASAIYDVEWNRVSGTVAAYNSILARNDVVFQVAGASITNTQVFGMAHLTIQNPMGTVGYKTVVAVHGFNNPGDSTSQQAVTNVSQYRSAVALSRAKITPTTAAKVLKVGTQLLIYKRLAS